MRLPIVISKILLTMAVIGVAWLVIRHRQQSLNEPARIARPVAKEKSSNRSIKWLSYALLVLMISASLIYLGWQVEQGYRLVTVRVVDAQTGRSVSYIARRMDVDDRHFVTQDGREIIVADGERIELSAYNPQQLP
ncbi:hypothetical protein A3195_05515 [Candidatus Thiodiazotropha endoloripes]|uniref:Antitermination protein NusG n=1 Tax=Candidatus Thiodiazotropha endoloripes TaxID=1818881 RepID=A0A1E2UJ65_9GAMM|nr:hypothetical protein A3194_16875 [Candidatus Thiodiazotropha endoloripes]ODB84757.1 hypothetical protein A3193_11495 [Candidatus Thiodiazotropha endoloripes]ODB91786.1 hypothetical protein A3195_05515 [Candidatus Thiodiazotropha endoloripes]ODB94581.1 hypothetical protein A3196_18325 [Candidatus Thiodiazotropha endoloripes]